MTTPPKTARVTYTPSIEPQDLVLRVQLAAPDGPVYGPIPPFDQQKMFEWMDRGAGVGNTFAPGESHVEVLTPFAWGPDVGLPSGLGELASPGSAPLVLPGPLEARWRVRALSNDAIGLLVDQMAREPLRRPGVRDNRCANVASVEVQGARGGTTREVDVSSLGRPFATSGKTPPFPVKHEKQGKTAKRSVTIRTPDPKDTDVRIVLDMTMQKWAGVVERWFQTAIPEERFYWINTDGSKLGAKGEQFIVRRMDYEDPIAFEWPFDVAYPLGLLIDMLHTAHLRGTKILEVTARL